MRDAESAVRSVVDGLNASGNWVHAIIWINGTAVSLAALVALSHRRDRSDPKKTIERGNRAM